MSEKTIAVIATEDQIRKIIRDEVYSILEQSIPEIMRRANRKEYLSTSDFEELTGCGARTQQYYRDEKLIPYSQEGRKIWYKTSDVEKFIDERKIDKSMKKS